MRYFFTYKYKFCNLGIAEKGGAISNVFYDTKKVPEGYEKRESPLIKIAAYQLEEYFEGRRKVFDLPLSFHGTKFKVTVWKAVKTIPYGNTCSYGEIAAMIDNPKASRAVGRANNLNQISIIVPCHRIIGHDGSLVGYAGGLEIKRKLLELEKSNK